MIKIFEESRGDSQLLIFIIDENGTERAVGSVILPEASALHSEQRREVEEVFNRPSEHYFKSAPRIIGIVKQ